jgi:hypothetical protein
VKIHINPKTPIYKAIVWVEYLNGAFIYLCIEILGNLNIQTAGSLLSDIFTGSPQEPVSNFISSLRSQNFSKLRCLFIVLRPYLCWSKLKNSSLANVEKSKSLYLCNQPSWAGSARGSNRNLEKPDSTIISLHMLEPKCHFMVLPLRVRLWRPSAIHQIL